MTSNLEDQKTLINAFSNAQYRPAVSFYSGDATQPVPHPKGDASRYAG